MDVTVRGAQQLAALSKRCKAAGEQGKGFRKEMLKGIQRSTKAPKAEATRVAGSELPQRGGLAAEVARAKLSTRTRSTGKNVGVQIIAKGRYIRSTDRGVIRKTQRVPEGWFTETLQNAAPAVRKEILAAMDTVARQITRG